MDLSRPASRFLGRTLLAAVLLIGGGALIACGGGDDGARSGDVIETQPEGEGGFTTQFGSGNGPDPLAALAEFLGIPRAQLEAEMQTPGATQAGVAALHGKTREQLRAFLIEQNTEMLEQAVKDQGMSQETADRLRDAFAQNVEAMLDGSGAGGAPILIGPGSGAGPGGGSGGIQVNPR